MPNSAELRYDQDCNTHSIQHLRSSISSLKFSAYLESSCEAVEAEALSIVRNGGMTGEAVEGGFSFKKFLMK